MSWLDDLENKLKQPEQYQSLASNGPLEDTPPMSMMSDSQMNGLGDQGTKVADLQPSPMPMSDGGYQPIIPKAPAPLPKIIPDSSKDLSQDQSSAAPAPMGPSVADYIKNKFNIGERQKIVDQNNADASGPSWAAALGAIGAGLQGKDALAAGMSINNAQANARQNKLDQFDKARSEAVGDQKFTEEQDKLTKERDPNSPESKMAQDLAVKMGFKGDTSKLTADQFKAFSPALSKSYDIAQRSLDRRDSNELRKATLQNQLDVKNDRDTNNMAMKLKDDLDPNKARGGNLAKSQSMINSADRIDALFKQFPDGNIPAAQTSELANATAALINGGSAQSQHQINSIVPSSAVGDANKIMSWFTNNPRGQDQQKFMQQLHDTAGREKDTASNQVKEAQVQRLAAHSLLKKKNPELYNSILQGYQLDPDKDIDEKGQYRKPSDDAKFSSDVVNYAKTHGITNQEAQGIKDKRTKGMR
jgi:hypothetical protein